MCSATVGYRAAAAVAPAGIAGTAPGAELRATVTAVVSPVTGVPSARYSGDLLQLIRLSGQVTSSARLPARPGMPVVERRYREAAAAVLATCEGLAAVEKGAGGGAFRPQSVLITAGSRLRVLTRLESGSGPVLAGGTGAAGVAGMLRVVGGLSGLPGAPAGPPRGWDRRPVVLRPPVAAVLLAGVRMVLGGAAAARLAGRRVFPDLTLVDRPAEHAENAPDDYGRPALAHTIVRSGRVLPLPAGPDPGIPSGRAVWCHEESRLVMAAPFGLALSGMPADPVPDGAVELVACAEGLRRYHPDGQLRLLCLARLADSAGAFLVSVRARPLSMLRSVAGVTGDSEQTYLEHEVNTPSLVLPSTVELARKCHVLISSL